MDGCQPVLGCVIMLDAFTSIEPQKIVKLVSAVGNLIKQVHLGELVQKLLGLDRRVREGCGCQSTYVKARM